MKPSGDTPRVIAPPPLIYLGFLLAGFGIGQLVDEPSLGLGVDLRRALAFGLVLIGLLIDGVAVGSLRHLGTPPEPWKPTTALATGGLYRYSRNPVYLGFAITFVGFALGMDSPLALLTLLPCLLVIDRFVVGREEVYLRAKFGIEYQAYQGKVRRWL